MKKKPVKKKPVEVKDYLDMLEELEWQDILDDRKRAEWKKSEQYAKNKELAEKFAKRRLV